MNIIIGYISTYTYIITVIIVVSLLNKKKYISIETSRKLIHILVGFSWPIMVYFFKFSYHLIIPPLSFIVINYITYKKNLIPSMKNSNNSKGTIYYALSFTILSIITLFKPTFLPFYGLGVLTMALGDGLAPFGGRLSSVKIKNSKKTYLGTLTVAISCLILTLIFNSLYSLQYSIIEILIISLSASFLEFFDYKGTDNLTLPLGVSIIAYLLTI